MIPSSFEAFLGTSATVSSALIGLLFVSISIAPERIFGASADSARQAQALSAFSALANIFFISLASLIPDVPFGPVVTVIAIPSTLQTLGLLLLLPHWRAQHAITRGLLLFLVSLVIYGYEFSIGIRLWMAPTDRGALIALMELLLGAYAIGLGRAWQLLGAPRLGWFGLLVAALSRARGAKPDERKPPSAKVQ
jgi:hypothetical protein